VLTLLVEQEEKQKANLTSAEISSY